MNLTTEEKRYLLFNPLLNSLAEQKVLLQEINSRITHGVPDDWFRRLDTDSSHVQSVRELEFFFVSPGSSFRRAYSHQLALIVAAQSNMHLGNGVFNIDDAALYPGVDTSLYDNGGIYRLTIDLLSGWDPIWGRSVDVLRMEHHKMDGILALGAYAAQKPGLFRSQDGYNLPYLEFADLEVGDGHDYVPNYTSDHDGIYLDIRHCEELTRTNATPARL